MRVSVVIPTYNRREHVLRAIESVFAQTVTADEIIIVDDGSTDGSAEAVCNHYGAQVKVIRKENGGVSAARNRGIREARCEWLAFLDSDDVWLPTKLERQFGALAELGSEFGACFSDCAFVGDGRITRTAHAAAGLECSSRANQLKDPRYYPLGGPPVMYAQSLLVLRSILNDLGGFDEAMPVSEDLDLFFRLTFKTKICLVSDPLVNIDRTPSRPIPLTEMYSRRDDRKYESHARLYTKWLALPEVVGTPHEERIRELLREVYYDSAEAKIHDFRVGPALQEIFRLRATGKTYGSIFATLLSRKIAKESRRLAGPNRTATHPAAH